MLYRANQYLFKKVDATGLAVFRIFYCLILWLEINDLHQLAPVLYDRVPYLLRSEFHGDYAFAFWKVALVFLGLGLFTRTAALVNYLFTVVLFGTMVRFEYHIFYSYTGVNFLLMFLPVSQVLSLDNLRMKLKYSTVGQWYKPEKEVNRINYFAVLLLGIAFVYADSVLYKLCSTMWRQGLGLWFPANLPMATKNKITILSDYEWVVKFLGYFVMVFEGLFLFLFWHRSFRIPFLIIGVGLHVGIMLEFPIPWFALAYVSMYMLLVPLSWWHSFSFRMARPVFYFYYDAECPVCIKTVVFIRHMDVFGAIECRSVQGFASREPALEGIEEVRLLTQVFGVSAAGQRFEGDQTYRQVLRHMRWSAPIAWLLALPGFSHLGRAIYNRIASSRGTTRCTADNCNIPVYSLPPTSSQSFLISGLSKDTLTRWFLVPLLSILTLMQVGVSIGSPFSLRVLHHIGLTDGGQKKIERFSGAVEDVGTPFFGIGHHSVFSDYHFYTYDHILKIRWINPATGAETTLPILTDEGTPGDYISGPSWADYTFRTTGVIVDWEVYSYGVSRYARHWLYEQNKGFDHQRFKIYVAKISAPMRWEKGALKTSTENFQWYPAANLEIDKLHTRLEPIIPDIEKF